MDDWWMDFNMISAAIANSAIINGKELLIPVSDNIIPDIKGITIRRNGYSEKLKFIVSVPYTP